MYSVLVQPRGNGWAARWRIMANRQQPIATTTGGLTGMRKNRYFTAARSRPDFDDVICAYQPPTSQTLRNTRPVSREFHHCQPQDSEPTSRFRALNIENFGSDLLPISRFSSEFRKLRPKFVLKFQYSDRAHHANYSIC